MCLYAPVIKENVDKKKSQIYKTLTMRANFLSEDKR